MEITQCPAVTHLTAYDSRDNFHGINSQRIKSMRERHSPYTTRMLQRFVAAKAARLPTCNKETLGRAAVFANLFSRWQISQGNAEEEVVLERTFDIKEGQCPPAGRWRAQVSVLNLHHFRQLKVPEIYS
jgi:hypothetical protein